MKFLIVLIVLPTLTGCSNEKIETGKTLDKKILSLIKSLGLLEKDEEIVKFYSNFEKDKAGSFFTNKRVAHYWLDRHGADKSDTTFAYYKDIVSIDTVYDVPDTFAPYMIIKKNDSTHFRAYVGGTKEEMKLFFEEAIKLWKQTKNK